MLLTFAQGQKSPRRERRVVPGPLRVAIAGGGLGGPAAAAALARAGVEPTVFERQEKIGREGSALFIAANGVKALHDLGIGPAFGEVAQYQRDGELRTPEGRLLFRLPADLMVESLGHPNACIERTALRRVLLDGAGRGHVRLGAEVVGFEEDGDQVLVRLSDGSTEGFDALVGADGIGSRVRGHVLGDTQARYVGYTAWRGVCETDVEWPKDIGCEQWGRGQRVGFSFLGRGVWGWWATKLVPQGGHDPASGRAAAVARPFAGWWGPIERLIRATPDERVLRNDIFVRPPDRAWGRGRVTLLGDAAHLMTPDLGQGACQAMIDAVTLARVLKDSQGQHVPERLRGYEALRIPQCELVARRSYKLGRSAHMASRPGVALRNAIMRAIPAGLQAARLRRVIERSMG